MSRLAFEPAIQHADFAAYRVKREHRRYNLEAT
jgi:hypothetical protein